MQDQAEDLERKLKAQDKTIRILSERVEQQISDDVSGFAIFEQNIALEDIVATRTNELESKRAELELALAELKATQAELLQSQKLQSIGQLASGIAHEINTPIQYVSENIKYLADSFAQLLPIIETYKSTATDEQEVDDLNFMLDEIPRALKESGKGVKDISSIISAMREFAHPGNGQLQPVDLHRLIQTTIDITGSTWKHVANIETHFDPELPLIDGLKDELGQVLLNLIVNAAHAIEDNMQAVATEGIIRITTRSAGDWAEIKVEDNGCGIPKELHTRIFDPFFTTKDVGRGSGQGLAIAYNVVSDKHHGKLSVHSEDGKGSVLTVRLPVKKDQKINKKISSRI